MGRYTQHTPETRAAALVDYEQGASDIDIEAKFGVIASTMRRWAKQAGSARSLSQRRNVRENSALVLRGGAWITGTDGIARWHYGAIPDSPESEQLTRTLTYEPETY